jgi:nicotinamide-nucleotide amidase
MQTQQNIETLVVLLAGQLAAKKWMMSCAESCTGGLIAASLTDLSGSSQWFERGFVTYSNAAKTESLNVPALLIETHGAVSEPVAQAMVLGCLANSPAQIAVAVTGVAGPSGGTKEKPVGMVCLAWAWVHPLGLRNQVRTEYFEGDRQQVRQATVIAALIGLLKLSH